MITYDWNCRTVDVHPQEEEETNVVYNVHYIVTGISDELNSEGVAYEATVIGVKSIPLSDGGEFIPFDELTNEIVTGWVKESLGEEGVGEIELSIANQIDYEITPKSITMTISD